MIIALLALLHCIPTHTAYRNRHRPAAQLTTDRQNMMRSSRMLTDDPIDSTTNPTISAQPTADSTLPETSTNTQNKSARSSRSASVKSLCSSPEPSQTQQSEKPLQTTTANSILFPESTPRSPVTQNNPRSLTDDDFEFVNAQYYVEPTRQQQPPGILSSLMNAFSARANPENTAPEEIERQPLATALFFASDQSSPESLLIALNQAVEKNPAHVHWLGNATLESMKKSKTTEPEHLCNLINAGTQSDAFKQHLSPCLQDTVEQWLNKSILEQQTQIALNIALLFTTIRAKAQMERYRTTGHPIAAQTAFSQAQREDLMQAQQISDKLQQRAKAMFENALKESSQPKAACASATSQV